MMKHLEHLPEELRSSIFQYYLFELRHRMNIRELKYLMQFTHAEPQMILMKYYSL